MFTLKKKINFIILSIIIFQLKHLYGSQQLMNHDKNISSTETISSKTNASSVLDISNESFINANENDSILLKCPIDLQLKQYKIELNEDEMLIQENENEKHKRSDSVSNYLIVQWYKGLVKINKLKLLNNNKYKQEENDLKIKNLNINDSGKYRCKIINGFGSVTSEINLIVVGSKDQLKASTIDTNTHVTSKNDMKLPFFTNLDKLRSRKFKKMKGSNIKFRCNAKGSPKPDILWYKNEIVLNEEDYGITRSKWIIELRDLRISDSGNYTCKVFNKNGFINATYELNVYDDAMLLDQQTPSNITVLSGMDAVLNCKIRTGKNNDLKWMKQITKAEYKHYVIQNNPSDLELSQLNKLNENLKPASLLPSSSLIGDSEDSIKSFYIMNTLSPLSSVGTLDNNNDERMINDLIGLDNELIENKDENFNEKNFNFDLFIPKEQANNKKSADINKIDKAADESVHYITLSSSPLVIEKQIYNKEQNYHLSQLLIKQADLKDTGIYVCFGSNSKIIRKTYLNVLKTESKENDQIDFKLKILEEKTNMFLKKQSATNNVQTITNSWSFFNKSTLNIQSFGILIVLIPVFIIFSIAIVAICYLKNLDSQKLQQISNENKKKNDKFFYKPFLRCIACFGCEKKAKYNNKLESKKNSVCCFPSYSSHVLMPDNADEPNSTLASSNIKKTFNSDHQNKNSFPFTTSSSIVGSSLSDSTSTTATTVAYYVSIPTLPDNSSSPPPPLPNSQPPAFNSSICSSGSIIHKEKKNNHYLNESQLKDESYLKTTFDISNEINKNFKESSNLERTVSTPSMAYYKIVDCDLIDWNSIKSKNEHNPQGQDETYQMQSSPNSRLYYQLTPSKIDSLVL